MLRVKAFFRNELTRLFLFTILCLLIGAVTAPHVYHWAKGWAAENVNADLPGWLESARGSIERSSFDRVFKRCYMAAAIILLYPFIRSLKSESDPEQIKAPLMTRVNPGFQGWKDIFVGFVYAVGYMGFLLLILLNIGWVEAKAGASLGSALVSALTPMIMASLIEEWLFRGVLFALLLRSLSPWKTIIGLSVFFAAVHFLKPHSAISEPIHANSGFELLGQIGVKFLHIDQFLGIFLTLLAVGVVLAYARHKTGTLWLSIGLHSGWIFCMKTYSDLTVRTDKVVDMMYGQDIREGVLPLAFVVLTGFAIAFYLKPKKAMF